MPLFLGSNTKFEEKNDIPKQAASMLFTLDAEKRLVANRSMIHFPALLSNKLFMKENYSIITQRYSNC